MPKQFETLYRNKDVIIKVRNLSVELNGFLALSDISFDVKRGSITAIIGPNGSGKTTLIKTLLGLIPVKSGSVEIFERNALRTCRHLLGHHPGCRLHLGYVPQRYEFEKQFPITVYEFLRLVNQSEKIIREKLKEVGMEKKIFNRLSELSGGELQRVLIARAILNDPEIIFFDEPISGVDISGEKTFYELIYHLNREHQTTCLLVSHELDIVFKYADQVLCLNQKLFCRGAPKEVLTSQVLRQLYGEQMFSLGDNK